MGEHTVDRRLELAEGLQRHLPPTLRNAIGHFVALPDENAFGRMDTDELAATLVDARVQLTVVHDVLAQARIAWVGIQGDAMRSADALAGSPFGFDEIPQEEENTLVEQASGILPGGHSSAAGRRVSKSESSYGAEAARPAVPAVAAAALDADVGPGGTDPSRRHGRRTTIMRPTAGPELTTRQRIADAHEQYTRAWDLALIVPDAAAR